MAATSTVIPPTSTSVRFHHHHRITKIYFDFSPTTSAFPLAEKKPIILRIKTPSTHQISLLPTLSHSLHFHVSAAAFNTFEDSQNIEEFEEEEEEEEEEEKRTAPAEERRLYVGNLPYSMTSSELSQIFSEVGRIAAVEIVYDRVTDRSRGFAFITMRSAQDAKEAIKMFDGSQIGGRTVKVNFPEVPRGGEREVMGPKIRGSYRGFIDTPYKIYAGNLGWRLTSEGLKEAFANQHGLLSAKVIYDRDSGKSRGFGFVSFASAEEAQTAVEAMNGVEVEGRPLRLNLAAERNASNPPPTQETKIEAETENLGNTMQSGIGVY